MQQSAGTGQPPRLRFGAFVLDRERGVLLGPDGERPLRPQAYAVLEYLVVRSGHLVSKEELFREIWGRTVVTDDSLTQCLVEIRRALGKNGREIIRTVPRRGYLMTTEVHVVGAGLEAVGAGSVPAGSAGGVAHIGAIPRATRLGFESAIAGVLLVAMVLFVGWRVVEAPDSVDSPAEVIPGESVPLESTMAEIAARGPTIAVLPFADMSPGRDHAYFGDGMAEEILNLLAETRGLRVIARTSSFSLRDARLDVRAIGRRLGATHVLEGSVRPDGDRVRVTAQLVDALEGAHLWSETYDRPLRDVLALQDEIAASVAALLHATFAQATAAERSVDPAAHEHKLRGAYLFSRRNEGDLEAARDEFEAALALEPDYTEAWVGLAGARWVLMLADGRMEPEELAAFRAAALRGVELAPGMPEAHLRARAAYQVTGEPELAARHLGIAQELDPDNLLLLGLLGGQAIRAGDVEQAIEYQYRALRRDPLHVVTRSNLVTFLLAAGRIGEARREFDKVVQLGHEKKAKEAVLLLLEDRHGEAWNLLQHRLDDPGEIVHGAIALHGLGRVEEALALVEPFRSQASYQAAFALAEFEAWRGEIEAGLGWLREAQRRLALERPSLSLPTWPELLALSPFLGPLRADSRFGELATIAP